MQHTASSNIGGSNMSLVAAAGISALASVASTLYSNWKNEQLVNKTNKVQQSNFENAYQLQSQDMQKAGLNPAMLASGSAALASAPAVQTAQNENIATSLAPLMQAFTQAYLAPAQKENIEADTKNKEGQFQHELDLQSNEFNHNLEVLGLKHEYDVSKMNLQSALNMKEADFNNVLQKSLEDYQFNHSKELMQLKNKFDKELIKAQTKYNIKEDAFKYVFDKMQKDEDFQHAKELLSTELAGKFEETKSVNDNTTKNTLIRGAFGLTGGILGGILGGPIGATIGATLGAAAPNPIGFR